MVEGVGAVPVAGDVFVPGRGAQCALGGIVGGRDVEIVGEQPDLVGLGLQPSGQDQAGVVAFVPLCRAADYTAFRVEAVAVQGLHSSKRGVTRPC